MLVAIAPPLPEESFPEAEAGGRAVEQAFRYRPNEVVYALDFDPRRVGFDLLEGWDREADAYNDKDALAFVSGPMYERHVSSEGHEITVPLGDLKFGPRVWRGRNRTAALQRAFIGIRHNGTVDFGYGALTPERAARYESFIGGLHSVYNDLEAPPASYRGAYSISMGQQIRYYLPRIRMVMGLRHDGRMEVLMSRDGLTLEQTKALARQRGLRAAYLPDHASKSRLIIPGVKGFSEADANWISGGATSFVHVPYMLRLNHRSRPLRGPLLAELQLRPGANGCQSPWQCGRTLGTQIADRALAGLNRLMEQGVEPVARLIWAPRGPKPGSVDAQRAPLREPPITADPISLRQRQQNQDTQPLEEERTPLTADLAPPLLLLEGEGLPPEQDVEGMDFMDFEALPPPPPLADAGSNREASSTGEVLPSGEAATPLPLPPLPLPAVP